MTLLIIMIMIMFCQDRDFWYLKAYDSFSWFPNCNPVSSFIQSILKTCKGDVSHFDSTEAVLAIFIFQIKA